MMRACLLAMRLNTCHLRTSPPDASHRRDGAQRTVGREVRQPRRLACWGNGARDREALRKAWLRLVTRRPRSGAHVQAWQRSTLSSARFEGGVRGQRDPSRAPGSISSVRCWWLSEWLSGSTATRPSEGPSACLGSSVSSSGSATCGRSGGRRRRTRHAPKSGKKRRRRKEARSRPSPPSFRPTPWQRTILPCLLPFASSSVEVLSDERSVGEARWTESAGHQPARNATLPAS